MPSAISFQGLLLDTAGQPLTDNVDLDFGLFDGLAGGAALWTESHLGVAVTDGVYSVHLGSTTPMGVALLSAGPVFLEIRVEGETLVPRQQLLAVPYARVAETVQSVGSFPTLYLEQMIAGFNFDGGLPANTDPDEGTADADGDGNPNFMDSDNDDDGISDAAEIAAGSAVNLLTPRLSTVTPGSVVSYASTALLVQGTGLSTLETVSFGAQPVIPTNLTATGFQIQVNPTHTPASRTIVATLANGQSGTSPSVAITNVAPTISSFSPVFLV